MTMRALRYLALLAALFTPMHTLAVQPDEVLPNPVLESRARVLSKELRCMVCQNQSIDDSDAPLARDLRILVRERLTAGDSDKQVLDHLVARYGEFVLLKPRFALQTAMLWLIAPALLLGGALGILFAVRRRARVPVSQAPLTAEEQEAMTRLAGERRN